MDLTGIELGVMTTAELAQSIDWAAAEGWNPGLSDATCFRAADPEGFLAARRDGRMVGSISSVRHGSAYGFIGLYIVEPGLRGLGIGSLLWERAMARQAGRVCGLDGVVAMQDAYARSGFVLAFRTLRFGGPLDWVTGAAADVVDLGPQDLDEVAEYDLRCFGAPRRAFLEAWLGQDTAWTLGVRSGGSLVGCTTVRRARDGAKVGPLFADEQDIAARLLAGVRDRVGRDLPVFIDVPEANAGAVALVDGGMSVAFETARMYAGGTPSVSGAAAFGGTTLELGLAAACG